jgi:hypothetical protein
MVLLAPRVPGWTFKNWPAVKGKAVSAFRQVGRNGKPLSFVFSRELGNQ